MPKTQMARLLHVQACMHPLHPTPPRNATDSGSMALSVQRSDKRALLCLCITDAGRGGGRVVICDQPLSDASYLPCTAREASQTRLQKLITMRGAIRWTSTS